MGGQPVLHRGILTSRNERQFVAEKKYLLQSAPLAEIRSYYVFGLADEF